MKTTLLLSILLCACGPKRAEAVSPGFAAAGAEQAALSEIAAALRGRDLLAPRYALAADLAHQLASGSADPEVRAAAVSLLAELRDEPAPIAAPPAEPSTPPEVAHEPDGLDTGQLDTGRLDTGWLDDAHGVAADERALGATAPDRLARGRELLRGARYLEALEALEPLKNGPAWSDARPFYEEAVDGHVANERERAGAAYVAARALPRELRRAGLLEVHELLSALLTAYPDTGFREPLMGNLERIEREMETLERSIGD